MYIIDQDCTDQHALSQQQKYAHLLLKNTSVLTLVSCDKIIIESLKSKAF